MVDPPSVAPRGEGGASAGGAGNNRRANHFRRCVNAGLALHGLSSNSDAFLPVSIDGARGALRGIEGTATGASPNRTLFEGSAAVALALEASTLCYRLDRRSSSSLGGSQRSRLGIQSGFYQGSSGLSAHSDNEPYPTAPALTYHEFLMCARPSSDRRRSILELDALLRPVSYPEAVPSGPAVAGSLPASVLASLAAAGIVANGSNEINSTGELQRRVMSGTSIERMQNESYHRSSRGGVRSSRQKYPGEWMEDISSNINDGTGGLLSSLSGNAVPFGRRIDHHHFALSTSLRPAAADSFTGALPTTLQPIMESMGVTYRPEVSLGMVIKDTAVDLSGVGSYWRSIFADRKNAAGSGNMTPREVASHTPILSVLGNSTRSYPRLRSISACFNNATNSRSNIGYLSRDVMTGVVPEKDDCIEAVEYCQELVDVYEPPMGSGLAAGSGENDDKDAYFDED